MGKPALNDENDGDPEQGAAASQQPKYAPLWHARLQRVVGSIHYPHAPRATRRVADKDYYAPSATIAQQDLRAFNAMLTDAYRLHKANISTTIVFSVNFKTFCEPQFNKDYMLALKQAPGTLLQFLTPRFVRIPPGTPQTLLTAKVQALAGIFRRIVLHTRPIIETSTFEFLPCSILATSWSDIEVAATRDPRKPTEIARHFCETANRLRVNALIEGIDTSDTFEFLLTAGTDFGSGKFILPLGDTPLDQIALPASQIRGVHRVAAPRADAPAGQRNIHEI